MEDYVRQNLIDAGCDIKMIEEFEKCCDSKKELELLREHRDKLLGTVHKCHKQIDCLDYLVYKLKKEQE